MAFAKQNQAFRPLNHFLEKLFQKITSFTVIQVVGWGSGFIKIRFYVLHTIVQKITKIQIAQHVLIMSYFFILLTFYSEYFQENLGQ